MNWPENTLEALFEKRYKRFFADFRLEDGTTVIAHCPNTGTMKTCLRKDARALITHVDNPKRKLQYTWQAVEMPDGWVGINTGLANRLVVEAIETDRIPELAGYAELRTEQKYGNGSRIDILLRDQDQPDCYVEVMNTTLLLDEGIAAFPDAVTTRGAKHLEELERVAAGGDRAVLFFCVQRCSAREVHPADQFDAEYGRILRRVVGNGVEVLAYRADIDAGGVTLVEALEVVL